MMNGLARGARMGTLCCPAMEQWLTMFWAVLAIFAVSGVGAAARRLDWLTAEADRSLLHLIIRVLFPALILHLMLGQPEVFTARDLVWPPLVGAATVLLGFGVAWAVGKSLGSRAGLASPAEFRTFVLCVGLYNYGFVPLPLTQKLYGEGKTVAVMFLHNVGVEIVLWTAGVVLISGRLGRDWWKRVFNGPTLAILAALFITFTGLDRLIPAGIQQPLRQATQMIGAAAFPLSLILIGAIAADEFNGRTILRGKRVILFSCLLRLGVLPAMFLALGMIVPASVELKRVIAIQAAMPAATFPIVLARQYNGDPPTALRVCIGTSLVSLATMTLWLSAGTWLLGA